MNRTINSKRVDTSLNGQKDVLVASKTRRRPEMETEEIRQELAKILDPRFAIS